ncbi:HlyD family secretion protein [Chryseobacterium fistulae]|uniref:Uncharacterized protein n=1 Tax=Chryseobacterium fistulae TaxID=2675058 RepID=A0A6N4XYX4_9FLAO|nr:hypothetical protein [Chryseobacterium fistulae]CAA7392586.1 hypothetical protein CHRY9393_03308 [Chryseobacterium fistulae]
MKNTIYLSFLLFIIIALVSLPVITIPISSSSIGVIRSVQENTKISAIVSGRIIYSKLEKNNQEIKQGDTLFIIILNTFGKIKGIQISIQKSINITTLIRLCKEIASTKPSLQTHKLQHTLF